ncbi:MAG: hypothetical protein Q6363_004490 [Candidatus Njordarchaeota archaeon]
MPISLYVRKKFVDFDKIVAVFATNLLRRLGDKIVSVESVENWNGCNVRVVVRDKAWDVVDAVLSIAREVEKKFGYDEALIVDIVDIEERQNMYDARFYVNEDLLKEFKKELRRTLGEKIVYVEAVDDWNGCNVRVVVRDKAWDVVDAVLSIARKVEKKFGYDEALIVDIVDKDEL